MKIGFIVRLAWREARSSVKRIGVYMLSITLGVGALVAVHSFRADVTRSVADQARELLGGDLRFQKNEPFSDEVRTLVDSLAREGIPTAEVTTLVSMVTAAATGNTRLLQLRAVEGPYPLYGDPATEPVGAWSRALEGGVAVVDPAALTQLDARVGDTLLVGEVPLEVVATVKGLPTDVGFQTAVGPRVYMSARDLERTGLVTFGSLARYEVFFRFASPETARRVQERHDRLLRRDLVDSDTAAEQASNLTEALGVLSRFLGLVGLTALFLGGIGVASAIHVYVSRRLTSVAVLRCIGGTRRDVFLAYLAQAAGLGLVGSVAGVLLGMGLQRLLPLLIRDVLPVTLSGRLDPGAAVVGVLVGFGVSVLFALVPMLRVRNVTPLQALRREYGAGPGGWDWARAGALGALAAAVLGLSLWQAPTPSVGLGYAGALAGTLLLLWGGAALLVRGTRRFFPRSAAYPVRQGVSNLFRPGNQTVAVTLALGFGAFLLTAVLQVERSLTRELLPSAEGDRPNLILFDVQPDQARGVAERLRARGAVNPSFTPIVPARIAGVKGRSVEELTTDGSGDTPPRWTLARLYRNTYRAEVAESEEVVAGRWWGDGADAGEGQTSEPGTAEVGAAGSGPRPARISIEADLSEDLGVVVGDRITWDVQGVTVESRITSIRYVDWSRFAPNFFVVFEPGILERAPQSLVTLAGIPDPEARATLQRDLVTDFPNVSVLDLARVQETLDRIVGQVTAAIRFLAAFSIAGGVLVLVGALSTSRFQRLRDVALLMVLGARRGQLRTVLGSEYLALGVLAATLGLGLGVAGAWLLVDRVFELDFHFGPLVGGVLAAAVATLTVTVGLASSRGALRRGPLETLRKLTD